MAYELTLEADSRLTRPQVVEALRASGADLVDQPNERRLLGSFSLSGLSAFLDENERIAAVLAEGMEDAGWMVHSRMAFRYVAAKHDLCEEQLRFFLVQLTERTAAFFILSSQYESVRAFRDAHGLHFVG